MGLKVLTVRVKSLQVKFFLEISVKVLCRILLGTGFEFVREGAK
jgi:hypothetical protein